MTTSGEHIEALRQHARTLDLRHWHTYVDREYDGWLIVDQESHTPLGWFFLKSHAIRTVQTHNQWLNRYIRAVEYSKAYWWAIVAAFAQMLACLVAVVSSPEPATWLFGGTGAAVGGTLTVIALTRFRSGK